MLYKWLHEPLIHFLLIGGLLFLLYGIKNDEVSNNGNLITISSAKINHLATLWEQKMGRPPSTDELDGLIQHQIKEDVLYREALAMGLDKGDTVIRRRLAQKLEFITVDIVAQKTPTDAELESYLSQHQQQFQQPSHLDFIQIYLNADKRGGQAQKDAQQLLLDLNTADTHLDLLNIGDPFMFEQRYQDVTEQEISQLFGQGFARDLFKQSQGQWQGPISSGYGLHLVLVERKTSSSQPKLSDVYDKVLKAWKDDQRQRMNQSFLQTLKQHYTIIVETPQTTSTQ